MTKPTSKRNKHSWRAMCGDLERAKRNREMVAQGQFVEYWIRLEQQLESLDEAGEWIPKIRK